MSRRSCAISSIDAAGARWNGQPEARQEWPCHQVAAFSLVGTARRRAEAGALASQGYVSELDPRAPFPRQTALTCQLAQRRPGLPIRAARRFCRLGRLGKSLQIRSCRRRTIISAARRLPPSLLRCVRQAVSRQGAVGQPGRAPRAQNHTRCHLPTLAPEGEHREQGGRIRSAWR